MTLFFELLGSFVYGILNLLSDFTFEIGGYEVSWLGLMVVFLIVSLAIGFLWKGGN